MKIKPVSGIMLKLLLMGMLTLAFNIQTIKASGTIYIRADGSVDPDTAPISSVDNITYTFADNIYDEIVIERDNIVVDGAGYKVQGTGSGTGVDLLWRNNVTIKNMEIKAFNFGIYLDYDSNYNTISGNNITKNQYGIMLYGSWSNMISGNNITKNQYGIMLEYSPDNTLRGNSMVDNKYNFWVQGWSLFDFLHDIDVSNTVDCKPIYYWVGKRDMAIPPDAGYVALVESTGITVQNLNLNNNGQGLLLAYTSNSIITRNNITNNGDGIWLYPYSSNNRIAGNNIANNDVHGISLGWFSNYNIISGNNIANNDYGIRLEDSSNNDISGNNITANSDSIWLFRGSSDNTISGNNITYNGGGIWLFRYSSNNRIYRNNFVDNTEQVYSCDSKNVWDDGYPSGGNYWSDYVDVDFYGGPYQNETGSDGIWDHPYLIDDHNKDRYPFLGPSGWPEYPPVAVMEAPAEGCVNKELSFIGAYSYDPDGGLIVSYQWDFGDGYVTSTTNPIITHAYTSIGTYKVTLVVTDDEESVSEPTEHTISIYALRPIAVIEALDEGYVKEPLTFDGSYSYDPDGGPITSYQWDFGDGTSSTQQNPTHTYTSIGTYEVTLVVTDDESQVSDPATHIIKIKGPVEATQELIETIKSWNLPEGTENSLTSKLEETILLLNKGNENGAIHKLMDFINQVEALREMKLTIEQADYLTAEAQRIIDLIKG